MKLRIIALILIMTQLIVFSACSSDGTEQTDMTVETTTVSTPETPAYSETSASSETPTPDASPVATEEKPEDFRPMIAGVPLEEYTLVISSDCEPEEGNDIADYLNEVLLRPYGITLPVYADNGRQFGHEIVIGRAARALDAGVYVGITDSFSYRMKLVGDDLYIAGGSCFALRYCVKYLVERCFGEKISPDSGFEASGSMFGEFLYEYAEGSDIRLMSNNSWNRDMNTNAWLAMREDCSARTRSVGLSAVYMAYHPDVICFQEMTAAMILLIRRYLKQNGYEYSLLTYTSSPEQKPYTCILYRSDRLELIEQGHHDFAYGNDANSKGYTWGLFEVRETGKRFIALSTHLWWKSETAEPGSNDMRTRQAREIVGEASRLEGLYDCPVFVMGDFNTRTNTEAFRTFLENGFDDAFDISTVYADDFCGYHTCNNETFARETSLRPYKNNAIDHIVVRNRGEAEVLTFDHARPYFYIKLSDHYPLYVDVKLG